MGRPKKIRTQGDDGKQHKSWDFTDFDTSQERIDWWTKLTVSTLVIALEAAPTTGKPHLQGRVVFRRNYTFAPLIKVVGHICIDFTKCEADDNYMRKWDGKVIVDVDNRQRKSRTDLKQVCEVVRHTSRMASVLDLDTSFQGIRMAEIHLKYKEDPRPIKPINAIWIYGIGDTTALAYALGIDPYEPMGEKWEGYDGHEVVLIRDVAVKQFSWRQVSKLVDQYPFRVPCNFGSRQARYHTIIFTSLEAPAQLVDAPFAFAHKVLPLLKLYDYDATSHIGLDSHVEKILAM